MQEIAMIHEYIETALSHAQYEIIKDEQPYYGEVPELQATFRSRIED
jgi:hypothetical protein